MSVRIIGFICKIHSPSLNTANTYSTSAQPVLTDCTGVCTDQQHECTDAVRERNLPAHRCIFTKQEQYDCYRTSLRMKRMNITAGSDSCPWAVTKQKWRLKSIPSIFIVEKMPSRSSRSMAQTGTMPIQSLQPINDFMLSVLPR